MKRYLNCFRSGGRRTGSASGLKELLQTWNPPVRVADDVQFSSIWPSNRPNKDENVSCWRPLSALPLLFTPNRVIDGEEGISFLNKLTNYKIEENLRINFSKYNITLTIPELKSWAQENTEDDIPKLFISNEIYLSLLYKRRKHTDGGKKISPYIFELERRYMTINKRERKDKKERGKEIRGREIGIIRLQDRQIVTTAASTLLTGRNTEWINRACYTFTRWTRLQQTNDKRWFLVTTGFGSRKPMPENERPGNLCALRDERYNM